MDTLEIFGTEYTGVAGIKATDDNDQIKTYIRPQGTKSISANGTGIDVTEYASVDVSVPSGQPTLQSKSVSYNPSETAQSQTVTADSGYDGLDEVSVSVGAISSTYVGSGITRRSSTDLTASGATVTVPSGYYSAQASKAVASGSATVNETIDMSSAMTINVNPSTGLISAGVSGGSLVTPSVNAGYISSGTEGEVNVTGSKTQQLTTMGATTYNTSATDQTISSGRFLIGTQTIKAVTVSGLSANTILSGTTVKIGDANDDDRIASVSGTVTFSTIYTGSTNPSSSTGSNGDIYLKVVS